MAKLRLVNHFAFDRWQKDESCHLLLEYEDFVSGIKSRPQTYSELLRPDDMIKPYVGMDANSRATRVPPWSTMIQKNIAYTKQCRPAEPLF